VNYGIMCVIWIASFPRLTLSVDDGCDSGVLGEVQSMQGTRMKLDAREGEILAGRRDVRVPSQPLPNFSAATSHAFLPITHFKAYTLTQITPIL
jgi:hypothetical protein